MPDGIELKDAATLITIEPSPSETAIYLMAYDTGALDLRTVQLAAIFAAMVEHVQDQIGNIFDSTLVYTDGTPSMGRAGITGDVQIPAGSNASEILPNKVLDSMLADVPEATVKGRNSGSGFGRPRESQHGDPGDVAGPREQSRPCFRQGSRVTASRVRG
jgi:hypothetical protein